MLNALLLNDTSLAGNHGSTLATQQIMRLAAEAGIEVVRRYGGDVDLRKIDRRGVDLVLVNGEGSLHSSARAAMGIGSVPRWATDHGLPSFLINSIYQNNSASVLEGVTGYNGIYLRDDLSRAELSRDGAVPDGVADVAMTWQTPPQERRGPRIIVTDASGKADNKALYQFSVGAEDRYFLPLKAQVPRGGTVTDRRLGRAFKFSLRHNLARFQKPSPDQARYGHAIAGFEDFTHFLRREAALIVTGRYHGVCLAAGLRIPFVALTSDSHKTRALLDEMGLGARGISREALAEAGSDTFEALKSFDAGELQSIEQFVDKSRRASQIMFHEIAAKAAEKGSA